MRPAAVVRSMSPAFTTCTFVWASSTTSMKCSSSLGERWSRSCAHETTAPIWRDSIRVSNRL